MGDLIAGAMMGLTQSAEALQGASSLQMDMCFVEVIPLLQKTSSFWNVGAEIATRLSSSRPLMDKDKRVMEAS